MVLFEVKKTVFQRTLPKKPVTSFSPSAETVAAALMCNSLPVPSRPILLSVGDFMAWEGWIMTIWRAIDEDVKAVVDLHCSTMRLPRSVWSSCPTMEYIIANVGERWWIEWMNEWIWTVTNCLAPTVRMWCDSECNRHLLSLICKEVENPMDDDVRLMVGSVKKWCHIHQWCGTGILTVRTVNLVPGKYQVHFCHRYSYDMNVSTQNQVPGTGTTYIELLQPLAEVRQVERRFLLCINRTTGRTNEVPYCYW